MSFTMPGGTLVVYEELSPSEFLYKIWHSCISTPACVSWKQYAVEVQSC